MPEDLNPDLSKIEAELKTLNPATPAFSRDRLLFEAGKASVGSKIPPWLWPTTTACFAATTAFFGLCLMAPAETRVEVRYVALATAVPPEVPEPGIPDQEPSDSQRTPGRLAVSDPSDSDLRRMIQVRRDVMRFGVDALPRSPMGASSEETPSESVRDLERWLQISPGTYLSPRPAVKRPAPKTDDPDD